MTDLFDDLNSDSRRTGKRVCVFLGGPTADMQVVAVLHLGPLPSSTAIKCRRRGELHPPRHRVKRARVRRFLVLGSSPPTYPNARREASTTLNVVIDTFQPAAVILNMETPPARTHARTHTTQQVCIRVCMCLSDGVEKRGRYHEPSIFKLLM